MGNPLGTLAVLCFPERYYKSSFTKKEPGAPTYIIISLQIKVRASKMLAVMQGSTKTKSWTELKRVEKNSGQDGWIEDEKQEEVGGL